jgi:hypothetical protein
MNRKTLAIAAIAVASLGTVVSIGIPAAQASSNVRQPLHDATQNCSVYSDDTPAFCLNNWSGSGDIDSGNPGAPNGNFYYQGVNRCNNGDYTTAGCPITGVPKGLFIYQYVDGNNGKCVGTDTTEGSGGRYGTAIETGCNETGYPGTGGGTGTIQVSNGESNGCPGSSVADLNSYWTNFNGGVSDPSWIQINGVAGDAVILKDNIGTDGECLQQFSG